MLGAYYSPNFTLFDLHLKFALLLHTNKRIEMASTIHRLETRWMALFEPCRQYRKMAKISNISIVSIYELLETALLRVTRRVVLLD